MITKENFDEIINDIREHDGFIDVQKADFMVLWVSCILHT